MAKNDEGEFELILGNRQLISVFLIVVILLGVFFAMGYIVGRNSAPAVETAREAKPVEVHWPPPDAAKPPEVPSAEPALATPVPPESGTAKSAPETTKPETPETKPAVTETAKATPPPAVEKPPAEKPKVEKSVAEKPSASGPPVKATARASVTSDPAPGDYWQVVATSRPEAEIVAEALAKKGFHSVVAPASRDGIFRVLVGPMKDTAEQAQTRTGLEAAGFKPIRKKY